MPLSACGVLENACLASHGTCECSVRAQKQAGGLMPGMRRASRRQGAAWRHTWRQRQHRVGRAFKHRRRGRLHTY
eukprot:524066-Prymnesium_polylepis.1